MPKTSTEYRKFFTADRFFQFHEQKGHTQVYLARRLGYHPTYIRKIKAHMEAPTPAFMFKACEVFGHPREMFMNQQPEPNFPLDRSEAEKAFRGKGQTF